MIRWLFGLLMLLIITGCASQSMDDSSSSKTTSSPEKMTTNQAAKQSHSQDMLKDEPSGIVPAEIAIPAISGENNFIKGWQYGRPKKYGQHSLV
ncbi:MULTISPECIES: hypothetical protein [Bacillus]|uniref:hypothetical protein n=1 Tax=Bacillus TaxID=1386 RepID=UPI001CB948BF|nr:MULTISPECIES: hypothetical protein [Bacillus]